MSDPTPFPTDPMKPEGNDPDLSQDADASQASGAADADRPDDRAPTHDEQMRDRRAAEQQDKGEKFTDIA
ncbi:hypothetical protein CW368_07725 [Actinomycetales bacterium SN12]|nr:hypothetical protein CW368_07725 [Actinomycetales bacterium SN12]